MELASLSIAIFLAPVFDDSPILAQGRLYGRLGVARGLKSRGGDQCFKIVRPTLLREPFFPKDHFGICLDESQNARLESAFDRVSSQIVGGGPPARVEQGLGVLNPDFGKLPPMRPISWSQPSAFMSIIRAVIPPFHVIAFSKLVLFAIGELGYDRRRRGAAAHGVTGK